MSQEYSPAQYNAIAAMAVTAYSGFRLVLNVIWHVRKRYFFVDFQKIEYEKSSHTVADMKKDIYNIFVERNLPRDEAWKQCRYEIGQKYDLEIKKYGWDIKTLCNPPYDNAPKNNMAGKAGAFIPPSQKLT
jgi:hypothetical protein